MFIGLNSQIFSQKRIKCIHRPEKNFTDAVFVEDFQPFQSGLFVIKRKSNNKDLLEIVLFDPNHLFFFSKKKSKYPYGEWGVCLSNIFNKDSNEKKINCSGIEEGPQEKALMRKKDKRE